MFNQDCTCSTTILYGKYKTDAQSGDKVLDEVTRVYFDRRRLQVDQLLSPSSSLRDQIKHELRLQELTASIDALTGGAFSAQLGG